MQRRDKYTLRDCQIYLEKIEDAFRAHFSFRSNKHEVSMVKTKIALITFDDKEYFIDK